VAAPVFLQSTLAVALVALVAALLVALAMSLAVRPGGEGSNVAPQRSPAPAVTLHRSTSESRVVVDGKTVEGESVTVVGKPGRSVKGKAGEHGRTGSAKGGAGGSASAKGGAATAGSVVIQTAP
jgi:hypothetical protein